MAAVHSLTVLLARNISSIAASWSTIVLPGIFGSISLNLAKLMFIAENQHGHKTVAAQTKWADDQQDMFDARVARGTAKGALAAAKQNALAAEVAFKTWQTEMATTRAEMRTLMG